MAAEVEVDTVPAVTVNVAEVAPAATVTLEGTLAALLLELDNATETPPLGAAAVSVTVPVPVWPLAMVLGLTVMPPTAAGGGVIVIPNVASNVEYEAVKVTVVALLTVPVITAKGAEVEP